MRTVNRKPVLRGVGMVLGALLLAVGTVRADVVTDQAAGLVILPKLVFNSYQGVDTEIQLSNTSADQIFIRCFYVNANSHCSNFPERLCNINQDCVFPDRPNGTCTPGWVETDFHFQLTSYQPIIWRISEGLTGGDFPLDGVDRVSQFGTFNEDSAIPPVAEDPFIGELKCFQVGEDEQPTARNDLKAEVTIVRANDSEPLDARGYNGVGIKAKDNNDNDNTLVLGPEGEYNGCPNLLIVDHFFDDAVVFAYEQNANTAFVRSDFTFVPCSENFLLQNPFETKLQFLVYNEFEQRFSTSTGVECFREIPLSDIDTAARGLDDSDPTSTNDRFSIFNIAVQGTLTGQTRIRPVDDGSPDHGNGIVAVAEEFHRTDYFDLFSVRASAAWQVDHIGEREDPDLITVPPPTFP